MLIVEINRSSYRSEIKDVTTSKGTIVIENLSPGKKDSKALRSAETELYSVFSKYKKVLDKCGSK